MLKPKPKVKLSPRQRRINKIKLNIETIKEDSNKRQRILKAIKNGSKRFLQLDKDKEIQYQNRKLQENRKKIEYLELNLNDIIFTF